MIDIVCPECGGEYEFPETTKRGVCPDCLNKFIVLPGLVYLCEPHDSAYDIVWERPEVLHGLYGVSLKDFK